MAGRNAYTYQYLGLDKRVRGGVVMQLKWVIMRSWRLRPFGLTE